MYPVLEVVQHIKLPLRQHRGGEDKVFLKTVDEWGWKFLIDSLLFCYHDQPRRGRHQRCVCEDG